MPQTQLRDEESQLDVSLFQLIDAFKRIVDQRLPGVQLKFERNKWSVKERTEHIMGSLKQKGALFFHELFSEDRTISELVVTFLAVLELIHLGLIKVFQPTLDSGIRLIPSFEENGGNGDGKAA